MAGNFDFVSTFEIKSIKLAPTSVSAVAFASEICVTHPFYLDVDAYQPLVLIAHVVDVSSCLPNEPSPSLAVIEKTWSLESTPSGSV